MPMKQFFCVVLLLLFSRVCSADDAATVSGQFLYAGKPPVPEQLELNKDIEYCGPFKPISEELLVDAKTRGIANVVVWLDVKASGRTPQLTEKQAAVPETPVVLNNTKCRFDPHVAVVRTGQPVLLRNDDDVAHAMLLLMFANDPISQVVPANTKDGGTVTFPKPEAFPASVTCPIHSWMKGYLLVADHPFVAVTDKQGKFTMPGLPAGEWTFRAWHESAGYIETITLGEKPATWKAGRFTRKIMGGKHELGNITVAVKEFGE